MPSSTHDITPFIGTWKLAQAYAVDEADNYLNDVYGPNPTGIIIYGADGRMSALITNGGRKNLDGDRQSAPMEQRAEAFFSSIGYGGTYTYNGTEVVHHIDIATYPNWVGTNLVRRAELVDGTIVLRTKPQMHNGVLTIIKLVWASWKPGMSLS
ncbi:MAG: hypothetical protein DELT_01171 [Desulfovibrio sp.]